MGSFKYFAYGSNLSLYRLACSCPSAKKVCNAQLSGYKLSFGRFSKGWQGGVASIEESSNNYVLGVVWDIPDSELPALDKQEGVETNRYRSLAIDVKTHSGDVVNCRTYQLVDLGGSQPYQDPSPQYLEAILDGATVNRLENDYLQKLKDTKTNGNTITTKLMKKVAESKEQMITR